MINKLFSLFTIAVCLGGLYLSEIKGIRAVEYLLVGTAFLVCFVLLCTVFDKEASNRIIKSRVNYWLCNKTDILGHLIWLVPVGAFVYFGWWATSAIFLFGWLVTCGLDNEARKEAFGRT